MIKVDISQRRDNAVDFFRSGYNCAQAVAMAYADVISLSEEQVAQNAGPFGGGMGRMGEVCGTLSGAFMVLGALHPMTDPLDASARQSAYASVRSLADDFRLVFGDILCRNLLADKKKQHTPSPDDPNSDYYKVRPCAFYVAKVAELLGERINSME